MFGKWKKSMRKGRPVFFTLAVLLILTAGFFVAGSSTAGSRFGLAKEELKSGFIIAEPGTYDSLDSAVVKSVDSDAGTVSFMNLETGKTYSLNFDGTTKVSDKYENMMAMSQVREGDIVELKFLKSKKKLVTMSLSKEAWVFDSLKKYQLDLNGRHAAIGDSVYSLRDNAVVLSDGAAVAMEDIIQGDIVSVSGIGSNVHSIVIEQGHGYLRLSSDEYLKGGWIEVGQTIIQKITEDMLLAVPEGTYDVLLKAPGIDEKRQVTIVRNKETVLDVSDVEVEAPKMGKVLFAVTPAETSIYIDGTEADISQPVELEYGIHQMIAKAEGYDTITQYLKVGQELASLTVTLEQSENGAGNEGSVSGNEVSSSYRVYIDSPSDVEVYLDGVYIGISPVHFKKEEGTHIISLRKAGYVTKSYTVQLDGEPKDVTYSFSDLVREEVATLPPMVSSNNPGKKPGSGTTSGNGVSGN